MKVTKSFIGFAACLLSAALTVSPAQALQTVTQNFAMPVQLQGSVTMTDCANAPGPQITFDGSMVLSGVNVQLIFRNNINKDVHTRAEDVQIAGGIAAGEEIVIPKQPSRGGVGGNPFIWVQIVDSNGQPLTGEIFLGRCVQGQIAPIDFATPVIAQALLEVLDCTNNPGSFINVSGSASFNPGVKARFIFRNNDNPVGGPHMADAIVDITLVSPGFTLTFPKQPVLGGVGGNPWISVQFASPGGQPIGNEFLLGRCVQLMSGN
ncbi:MAG: hypothetical protein ACREI3_01230 [Nitrospirales bacterium]